jgi:MFS family permease
MAETAKAKLTGKMLGVLFIFGFVNAIMYTFPYVRYVFYEQQIIAMGITNTQSGQLMSIYSLCMMASMIPGGILADKFSTKKCLVYSVLASFVAICIYAFTMTFAVACFVWFMVGLSTNFVFWCGITKAVGMVGDAETQGSCYGIYYASSGIISAVLNAICLWASGFSEDPTTSFMIAMWVMAGGTLLAALLVVVFFKEKDVEAAGEEDTFQFKYVGAVLKNPMTWLIAVMVMCAYGLYTSVSYFSPYLTDVLGIPLVNSTLLNIVRSNLMNLLCPVGGYIIDRVFKSANKWYITAFAITTAIYAGVMIMPDTVSPGLATVVSLLPSMVAMMLYGVIWSGLRECKFKAAYFGTVIGIGSILGYTPDFFYFTIFGKWMDTYGNAAYKMIFGFLMATAVLGMILAVIMRVLISRNKMKVEE